MKRSKLNSSSAGVLNVVDDFGAAVGALVSDWYGALVFTMLVVDDVGACVCVDVGVSAGGELVAIVGALVNGW